MNKLHATLVLFIIVIQPIFSQVSNFKFGIVQNKDFEKTQCSFYPEANSMIEGESGIIRFKYDNNNGWRYVYEKEVRKRIFDITDADEANINIMVYNPVNSASKEDITNIKGYSYNLVDGKVVREKVKNKEFYETRINDYWIKYSFAIPNVKKGTIIEYSYTKQSDYIYNLSTWEFQETLPKAFSELSIIIPEYFNYQFSQVGNYIPLKKEESNKRESFTYSWKSLPQQGGRVVKGTNTLDSNSKQTIFYANEVKPVQDEPFMNNKVDLPARMEFQLISTQFPNSTLNVVAGNYKKFNSELLKSSNFGDHYLKGSNINDLLIKEKDQLNKCIEIYNAVANNYNWNGTISFTSSEAGRKSWKEQTGTVADINLTLIGLLREHDINAYPILLSIRGKGVPHPIYPSYQDFNYVIAAIKIGENYFFCDASSKYPFANLPLKCRNGKGFLVNDYGGQWINLKIGSSFNKTTALEFNLTDSAFFITAQQKLKEYAAYETYNDIQEDGLNKFSKEFKSKFEGYSVESLTFSEIDRNQPLNIDFKLINKNSQLEDVIYIQPILTGSILESPFISENRQSPIDFPYFQSYSVYTKITIPEGYSAELPQPGAIKLPNNDASYLFNLSQSGNSITVLSKLIIDKADFSASEYVHLKAFMEAVAEKNNELIILTKN